MKKALIVFQSKNSSTRQFGEEIAQFLIKRGLVAELIPINNFEPNKLKEADYLLVSGWKNGSLFSASQPDSEWMNFVNSLPTLDGIKTALFTNSKLFTGRMIKKMKKYLTGKINDVEFTFNSSNGSLSISDQMSINEFID